MYSSFKKPLLKWLQEIFSGSEKAGPPSIAAADGDCALRPCGPLGHDVNYKGQGDALLGQGKLAEAAASYREAIGINWQDADAHLNLGFVLGEQQNYKAAEHALMQALEINPQMPDAFYILGVMFKAQGNQAGAIENWVRALELKPDFEIVYGDLYQLLFDEGQIGRAREVILKGIGMFPGRADFYWCLGNLQAAEGHDEQARNCFLLALSIRPDYAPACNALGMALARLNRYAEALASYDRAIQLQPDFIEAFNNRGVALEHLDQPEQALDSYGHALRLQPENMGVLSNRSNALLKLKRYEEALAGYEKIFLLHFCNAEILSNHGSALAGLGRHAAALASYDRALELKPDSADILFNRGNMLARMSRIEEALASYDRSLLLRPNDVDVLCNRGNALRRLKRSEEALACYDLMLRLRPDSADAFSNRSGALGDLHRYEEALASCAQALQLQPDHVDANFHEATLSLLHGDFELGWKKYEWRWRVSGQENYARYFSQPVWLGKESLHGKSILLHAEQGFGDTIQFCRYVKLVAATGARVIIETQSALGSLLSSLNGVCQVVVKGDPLPAFDYHCPLLSLPLAFNTCLKTIPAEVSYLASDPARVEAWRSKLGERNRPRVGLVWSGNASQTNDHNRSIPMSSLIELASGQAQYVCLQKEVRENDVPILGGRKDIAYFGDDLVDFAETAALLSNMDLVISVCTSVAHLAGAMGKPVWLLLSFNADWRWMLDRSDSPWYPSMRLFRQPENGDWDSVVLMLAKELNVWSRRFDRDTLIQSGSGLNSQGGDVL